MLEITADVLYTFAAEWVRELLDHEDEEFLYPLSWAAAGSLPGDEGLHHICTGKKRKHDQNEDAEPDERDALARMKHFFCHSARCP